MGLFGPKDLIKWREPRIARQARELLAEKATPWWKRPGLVTFYAGLLVVTASVQGYPARGLPWTIALSLCFGLVLVYVLPVVISWLPSEVCVHEEGVYQHVPGTAEVNRGRNWKFTDIEGFRIVTPSDGPAGSSVPVLTIKGSDVVLGIAADVGLGDVRSTMLAHGVEETTTGDDNTHE